jgi:GGDEF domain-containing protein
MEPVAVGFWGAYFGTAGLLLGGALLAFTRSARRIAFTGSLAAVLSSAYVVAYLGWIPGVDGPSLMRVQAQLAAVCAAVLGMLLFSLLGLLRQRRVARMVSITMSGMAAAVVVTSWVLPPADALAIGIAMELLVIPFALAASLRTAVFGARAGWLVVLGVGCMVLAACGLTWFALAPERTPWPVHAVSALAASAYLLAMAGAMWSRYAYLIDVRQVMVHGPSFDPVTRLPSHVETSARVRDAFHGDRGGLPLGVIAVSIANLQALEQLHGRSAWNHGLFVCASRLRRLAPPHVELGRVRDDGFLMLVRRPASAQALIGLAQDVVRRLSRPVALGTSGDIAELEASRTRWVAEVGVGLLVARPDMKPGVAVAGARAMSRTAWSYPSRMAWYDEDSKQITELAAAAPAPSSR